jgi:hypothetical protein
MNPSPPSRRREIRQADAEALARALDGIATTLEAVLDLRGWSWDHALSSFLDVIEGCHELATARLFRADADRLLAEVEAAAL